MDLENCHRDEVRGWGLMVGGALIIRKFHFAISC